MPTDDTVPGDEVLLRRAAAGETAAFEQLVNRYYSVVHTIARGRTRHRESAEDLAQEVFLRVYLSLGRIAIPSHFAGWLVRVTHNLATDWGRRGIQRSKLVQMVPIDVEHLEIAEEARKDARTVIPLDEHERALHEAVSGLPESQREIVLLHFTEELSQKEIADLLGVHPSTVGRQLKQALAAMRGRMEALLRESGPGLRPSRAATARAVALIGATSALGPEAKANLVRSAGGDAWLAAMTSAASRSPETALTTSSLSASRLVVTARGLIAVLAILGLTGAGIFLNRQHGQAPRPEQPPALTAVASPATPDRRNVQASTRPAPAPAVASRRLLFPADRSLGRVTIQDDTLVHPADDFYYWGGKADEWEYFAEARGMVVIPPGKRVHLVVGAEGVRDLSPLKDLPPGAVSELSFSEDQLTGGESRTVATDDALRHVAQLRGLRYLHLSRGNISARGLAHVRGLASLEKLRTPFTVDRESLAVICSMPGLKALYINSRNELMDQDLELLAGLSGLEEFSLSSGGKLTDAGLAALRHLKHLRYLFFNKFEMGGGGGGMVHLAQLPLLRTVKIGAMPIGDAGLAELAKSPSIESLSLRDNMSITNAGVAHLQQMPSLRKLDLADTSIGDAGLVHISEMKQLEFLQLPSGTISDRGLAYLGQLPGLKTLDIPGRHTVRPEPGDILYTADGVKALTALRNLEELSLGTIYVDDRAMESIAQMTGLKKLRLYGGPITNAGLARLGTLTRLEEISIGRHIPRGQERAADNISIGGLAVLNNMPLLRRVSIRSAMRDDATLNISGLKHLEQFSLSLPAGQAFRDEDLACLTGLTRLKDLQLIPLNGLTDAGMRHLAPLVNLEKLIIGGEGVTDAGLKCVAGMRKLGGLSLKGTFTDEGLPALDGLKNLSGLTLDSGGTLSESAVQALWSRLPQITLLDAGISRPAPVVGFMPARKR